MVKGCAAVVASPRIQRVVDLLGDVPLLARVLERQVKAVTSQRLAEPVRPAAIRATCSTAYDFERSGSQKRR
jgi:hypothetical protein